jgi:hypothetical protein
MQLLIEVGLVGGYKDLGFHYLGMSRSDRAWRCWDAAR